MRSVLTQKVFMICCSPYQQVKYGYNILRLSHCDYIRTYVFLSLSSRIRTLVLIHISICAHANMRSVLTHKVLMICYSPHQQVKYEYKILRLWHCDYVTTYVFLSLTWLISTFVLIHISVCPHANMRCVLTHKILMIYCSSHQQVKYGYKTLRLSH